MDLSIYPNGRSVVSGQQSVVSEEKGILQQAWEWVTGTGGPSADETVTLNEDGTSAEIETINEAQTNRTGENGVLRFQLPDSPSTNGQNMLIARRGKDVAFLPENTDYYWQEGGNWYKKGQPDYLRWFVFDDRKMYKPKEEVAVKGYIRKVTAGKLGDVEGLGDAASGLTYSVKDPRNNEIAKGTAQS